MNELIDVLSVWWIKVVLDLTIVYCFLKVASNKETKPVNYSTEEKISQNLIP
jgi:hypothetical protein